MGECVFVVVGCTFEDQKKCIIGSSGTTWAGLKTIITKTKLKK